MPRQPQFSEGRTPNAWLQEIVTILGERGLNSAATCCWLEERQFRNNYYTALWMIEAGDSAEVLEAALKVGTWEGSVKSSSYWATSNYGSRAFMDWILESTELPEKLRWPGWWRVWS